MCESAVAEDRRSRVPDGRLYLPPLLFRSCSLSIRSGSPPPPLLFVHDRKAGMYLTLCCSFLPGTIGTRLLPRRKVRKPRVVSTKEGGARRVLRAFVSRGTNYVSTARRRAP